VNYVAKGANLYDLGYRYHGSANVAAKHLRMGWLWDRIRVQGGAYGAFCAFDRFSGVLGLVSYRDPNIRSTLEAYDRCGERLRELTDQEALESAVVGAVGDIDAHMLPDAKGFASMARWLTGDTEERRQAMREQVLATTTDDLEGFARALDRAAQEGKITILGGRSGMEKAALEGLELSRVL
jgi:hypothetical protein